MAGTRWVKIDVSYLRNPKITALTPPAVLLHLASILWSADQLTDGTIYPRTLPELAHSARIPKASLPARITELETAGLWERNGDGWHLHDFEVMNRQALRAAVEKQRKAWRDAKLFDND
jgi:hypothetical protein